MAISNPVRLAALESLIFVTPEEDEEMDVMLREFAISVATFIVFKC